MQMIPATKYRSSIQKSMELDVLFDDLHCCFVYCIVGILVCDIRDDMILYEIV